MTLVARQASLTPVTRRQPERLGGQDHPAVVGDQCPKVDTRVRPGFPRYPAGANADSSR